MASGCRSAVALGWCTLLGLHHQTFLPQVPERLLSACSPANRSSCTCLPVRSPQFFEWLASDLPSGDGTPDALSEALKEEVWPNPLKFYFAEVPEGNFEGEGGGASHWGC